MTLIRQMPPGLGQWGELLFLFRRQKFKSLKFTNIELELEQQTFLLVSRGRIET